MGQETTLARESPSHDVRLDDQGNDMGDGVEVLVYHDRPARKCLFQKKVGPFRYSGKQISVMMLSIG